MFDALDHLRLDAARSTELQAAATTGRTARALARPGLLGRLLRRAAPPPEHAATPAEVLPPRGPRRPRGGTAPVPDVVVLPDAVPAQRPAVGQTATS